MAADGKGVVAHAGAVPVRLLADRVGLTRGLSGAVARAGFVPVRDRGQVLVDLAVMLAAGGEAISDIDTLRDQSAVFGAIASDTTCWRTMDAITTGQLGQIARARAAARAHVWSQFAGGRPPASRVAGTTLAAEVVVLDVDATLVTAHSEKESAAATFKRGFGFHPLGVWCDNTTEMLAIKFRAGNAGSNTAADHLQVLTEAIAQLPATARENLLVRVDGAGASHELVQWLTGLNTAPVHGGRGRRVEYSIGFSAKGIVTDAIRQVKEKHWAPAIDADGRNREGGDVVEVTGLLREHLEAKKWPADMRLIVRRERPHPGAQLSLFEESDGYRYQAFVTNTKVGQIAFLEARHRAHARVEDRIRHAKDTGLNRLPSRQANVNTAWCLLVAIAADLIAWLRLLALPAALKHAEPKALRYRFLHVPAQFVTTGRRRILRVPKSWKWAKDAAATFTAVAKIPAPT